MKDYEYRIIEAPQAIPDIDLRDTMLGIAAGLAFAGMLILAMGAVGAL